MKSILQSKQKTKQGSPSYNTLIYKGHFAKGNSSNLVAKNISDEKRNKNKNTNPTYSNLQKGEREKEIWKANQILKQNLIVDLQYILKDKEKLNNELNFKLITMNESCTSMLSNIINLTNKMKENSQNLLKERMEFIHLSSLISKLFL